MNKIDVSQCEQLKAENEELKKYVQLTSDGIIVNDTENFTRVCALEQKLEKIKQIAEENIKRCDECKNETGFIEELDCFEMICEYKPLKDFSVEILKVIEE